MTRAVCWGFVCALILSTASQAITVDESISRVILAERQTTVSLALENPSDRATPVTIRLEWLRPDDTVAAGFEEVRSVQPGRSTAEFAVPLSSEDRGDSRLAWFRLRYHISGGGTLGSGIDTGGTMALANVCDEVFELHIAGPQEALAGGTFPAQIRARHPVSGRPVAGVELAGEIELEDRTLTASATTNAEGLAEIEFAIPPDAVDKTPDLDIDARLGDFEEFAYIGLQVAGSTRIQIHTDKPLYQPGQTLHVRLLCLSPAGPARSGLPVEVRILDPEGTAAFVEELTTNRFGVAHFDWRIPDNLRLGDYMITADPNEGGDGPYFSRTVKVSRYELPAFSVSAQADRAYYLPGQDAEIEVRANYLFGKPVAGAEVRLVREFGREWSYAEQRWVVDEGDEWHTQADASGVARVAVPLGEAHKELAEPDGAQYQDLLFAAYATDPTTGRTEQRRFDLRISRSAIHIYLVGASDGIRTFVSTSYADGTPASCRIRAGGREVARTNSYGLARIALPDADEVTIEADDGGGRTGRERFDRYHYSGSADEEPELAVSTDRNLYRPGEPIRVDVVASDPLDAVVLQVLRNDRALSSQWLDLTRGRTSLTIPWREEFVHDVTVAVATGDQFDMAASRTVLYPADRDLRVDVRFEQEEYRPGDEATVRLDVRTADGEPVEAALGVSVVDAAVGERGRTDAESNYRRWWGLASVPNPIGGVTWEELSRMDTSEPFSDDLDLVAEAMLARTQHWPNTGTSASYQSGLLRHFGRQFQIQFRDIKEHLDARYRAGDYSYPRNEADLLDALADGNIDLRAMRDPWGSPFHTDFYFHQRLHWLRFVSAGPDKRFDTGDDLTAQAITRPHFEAHEDAMLHALRLAPAFPASLERARDILREAGIDIDEIRDPWGSAYRPRFEIFRTKGTLVFDSAGPDRAFETEDDFTVGDISGQYFAATAARLNNTIREARRFPRNLGEWTAAVGEVPIDDAWGNPTYPVFSQSSKYTELQEIYTAASLGGPARQRIRFRPATQTSQRISLRSPGPDGNRDTRDDFTLAEFSQIERYEEPDEEAATVPGTPVAGGGAIVGIVTDASGAFIPDVEVNATCPDEPAVRYGGVSNEQGYFLITGLPPCLYLIRAASPGFMSFVMSDVRVREQETTVADIQMDIGAVTEMVTVSADPVLLQTTSAQVAVVEDSPAATPRLREYFPETLLWAPDVETGPDGETLLRFPLADSITTWELGVMGSTADGQLGSGTAKVRVLAVPPKTRPNREVRTVAAP